MGTSVLHIKTEVECRVYLFDEEKGIAKPGTYFNLEVRKGEQDLLFVSTEDEHVCCQFIYSIEDTDCDYRIIIERRRFQLHSSELLELLHQAEQGDDVAQYNLGGYYLEKKNEEFFVDDAILDHKEAMEWFRRAAINGNSNAQCELGRCYLDGIWGNEEDEHDYEEAIKWFRRADEQNDNDAKYYLGKCYYYGMGVEKDYEEAVKLFQESAESGNIMAQRHLAKCYECGASVEQNIEEAIKWYRIAGERDGEIEKNLSIFGPRSWCSYWDEDVNNIRESAFKNYVIASKTGDFDKRAIAKNIVGECYYIGYGVEPDWYKAKKLFEYASNFNNHAFFNLGWCYLYGIGVEKDENKAVHYFKIATNHWNFDYDAMYALGRCYKYGIGVEQSTEKANECFYSLDNVQDEAAKWCGLRYRDIDGIND